MNARGHYGNARSFIGSTAIDEPPSDRIGAGTVLAVTVGGIAIAMLGVRLLSGAHRNLQRELREINRPLATT